MSICTWTNTGVTKENKSTLVRRLLKEEIYKQIRHIHKPKAYEKTPYEWLSNNLREHWLEIYLKLTLEEAKTVLHYANYFFGMAIK